LSAFSNITISTYLAGAFVESKSVEASMLSASLLSTGSKGTVGFVTTAAFDEVRLTTSALLALGDISIYNAVFQKFCAGPALSCNLQTAISTPSYPLSINNANSGLVSGATMADIDNAISNSTTDYATMTLTASVLSSSSISVIDNVTEYTAGTFAGFDIESASLLSVGALSNITISTYNNGIGTGDIVSGSSLLVAGSSILTGTNRQVIGFITTQNFDEVKLSINGVATLLTTYKIYNAVLQNFCSSNLPPCNTLSTIHNVDDPVYVNGAKTNVDAIACVGCSISNSQNVIDNVASNFASIDLTVGVATTANFSVANALDTYPIGTFAGFDIESNSIVSAAVISSATIKLYNNGSLVQTGTGNALIVGATSSLLSGTTRQTAGIVSTVLFDEIQISFDQLVGADLGTVKIYSAIIEKTCAPTILCNSSYYLTGANFPTVINAQRTGVSGVVSALAGVNDAGNVVTSSTTDFATITNTAAVAAITSISVLDPITTYPNGTFAGYVISIPAPPLVLLDLLNAITVSTYNNNVLQESKSGSDLIDLTVLAKIIGSPVSGTPYNIGFVTTQDFDEIRISVSSLVGVSLLGGGLGSELNVYGAFIDTRTSDKSSAAITCQVTNPDFNTTFLGTTVTGNVNTNDLVTTNSKYGTPVANPSNPTTTLPIMNPDGSYSFTPTQEGVYNFNVPVCPSDSTIICPYEMLTITVLKSNINGVNPPVANTDIATTTYNTSTTINTLANDEAGHRTLIIDTSSVSITDLNGGATGNTIKGGTATVNAITGEISYTPAINFIGTDTIQYSVCDKQTPALCASAYQVVTVLAPGSSNTTTASDDYKSTISGVMISGNVKNNDNDAEGDNQTVTANSITHTDYTFSLLSDGSYTFTPSNTFVGALDIIYQTCDDGTPIVCSDATLHLLVGYNYHTNPDINSGYVGYTINGDVSTNDKINSSSSYGTAIADISNPTTTIPTVNIDGTYSFLASQPGVYKFTIPVCPSGMSTGCPDELLTITVLKMQYPSIWNPPVANTDIASTFMNNPVVLNTLSNDASGSKSTLIDTGSVTINDLNGLSSGNTQNGGTATVNPLNGMITYTPATGFMGIDTISYTVCDNQVVPMCATAFQVINVAASGDPNTTVAADDYKMTVSGTVITGNVKDNDSDPEGNTQTVTANSITSSDYSFVLLADGSYTFTPSSTFTGSIDIIYETCDNGTPIACTNATIHFLVGMNLVWKTNADFNAGFIGNTINGDVHTNDNVPVGSSYGSPASDPSNPATTLPIVNADGTYSFIPTIEGVYNFFIPVCPSGVTVDCPNEILTITVLDNTVGATNPPIANTDITSTPYNTSVIINSLENDAAGTPTITLVPSSMTITDLNGVAAGNTLRGGTATVNLTTGNITYTPSVGFIGIDSIQYTICDNQPVPMCASAYQVVTVLEPSASNTTVAADDYDNMVAGSTIYGNAKNNDSDPEGDLQTITPKTVSTVDYTFTMTSDGNYTMTASASYFGPIDITYETCDNGSPVACANGTIHFLVSDLAFPLPIVLLDFSVSELNCNTKINWKVRNSKEIKSVHVLYSKDGNTWETLNSNVREVKENEFVVNQNSINGKVYYKLKIETLDGKQVFSPTSILSSACSEVTEISIFPNPTNKLLNLKFDGEYNNGNFIVTEMSGRVISEGKIQKNQIDLKDLVSGFYFITVILDNRQSVHLIQVKK